MRMELALSWGRLLQLNLVLLIFVVERFLILGTLLICVETMFSHTQNITVTPAAPPTFLNPPADLNVTCDNIPTGAPDLDYTNNENGSCLVMGTVAPTQSGTADICGGTVSYTWDFTDICGNNVTHTQNITVTPAAPPTFLNPPADLNVTCDNIPTGAPDLDYTNNENGTCLVMGRLLQLNLVLLIFVVERFLTLGTLLIFVETIFRIHKILL